MSYRQPLSYRHLYHAGNHGDVLKHSTLACLIGSSIRRHRNGTVYVDTHAGPGGVYDLSSDFATKRAENRTGVSRIHDIIRLSALNPHIQAPSKLRNLVEGTKKKMFKFDEITLESFQSKQEEPLYLRLFGPSSDLYNKIPTIDGYGCPGSQHTHFVESVSPDTKDVKIPVLVNPVRCVTNTEDVLELNKKNMSEFKKKHKLTIFRVNEYGYITVHGRLPENMKLSDLDDDMIPTNDGGMLKTVEALSDDEIAQIMSYDATQDVQYTNSPSAIELDTFVRYHLPLPSAILPYASILHASNRNYDLANITELPDPDNLPYNMKELYNTNPYKLKRLEERARKREKQGTFHTSGRLNVHDKAKLMKNLTYEGVQAKYLPKDSIYRNNPDLNEYNMMQFFQKLHEKQVALATQKYQEHLASVVKDKDGNVIENHDIQDDTMTSAGLGVISNMEKATLPIDSYSISTKHLANVSVSTPFFPPTSALKVKASDILNTLDDMPKHLQRRMQYGNKKDLSGDMDVLDEELFGDAYNDGREVKAKDHFEYRYNKSRSFSRSSDKFNKYHENAAQDKGSNGGNRSKFSQDGSGSKFKPDRYATSKSMNKKHFSMIANSLASGNSILTNGYHRIGGVLSHTLGHLYSATQNIAKAPLQWFSNKSQFNNDDEDDGVITSANIWEKVSKKKFGKKKHEHKPAPPVFNNNNNNNNKQDRPAYSASSSSSSSSSSSYTYKQQHNAGYAKPMSSSRTPSASAYAAPMDTNDQELQDILSMDLFGEDAQQPMDTSMYDRMDYHEDADDTIPTEALKRDFGDRGQTREDRRKLRKRLHAIQEDFNDESIQGMTMWSGAVKSVPLAVQAKIPTLSDALIEEVKYTFPEKPLANNLTLHTDPVTNTAYVSSDELGMSDISDDLGVPVDVTKSLARAPSSPFIFSSSLRPGKDRLLLSELHGTEFNILLDNHANPMLTDLFKLQDQQTRAKFDMIAKKDEVDPKRPGFVRRKEMEMKPVDKNIHNLVPPELQKKKLAAIGQIIDGFVLKGLEPADASELLGSYDQGEIINVGSGIIIQRKNGFRVLKKMLDRYRDLNQQYHRIYQSLIVEGKKDAYANTRLAERAKVSPGIVLIDPAYEGAHEFALALDALRSTMMAWPNACVAVWYPILRDGALLRSELKKQQDEQAAEQAAQPEPPVQRDEHGNVVFLDLVRREFEKLPRYQHRSLFLDLARRILNSYDVKQALNSNYNYNFYKQYEQEELAQMQQTIQDKGYARSRQETGRMSNNRSSDPVYLNLPDSSYHVVQEPNSTSVIAEVYCSLPEDSPSMTTGSGMLIVNPPEPEHLRAQCEELVPWLSSALSLSAPKTLHDMEIARRTGKEVPNKPVGEYVLEWF